MSWDCVPSEIFDAINEYLDLNTIKSLRLVSKYTSQRCLGPRFLFFASQVRTDLTSGSLQVLDKRASHPVFRNAVRCLIIQATFYDHCGHYPKRRKLETFYGSRDPANMEWLKNLQKERNTMLDKFIIDSLVNALNQFSALDEIKIQPYITIAPGINIPLRHSFTFRWASHVCFLTLAAAARGSTILRQLGIYQGCEPYSEPGRLCSVPAREIAVHLKKIKGKRLGDIYLPIESLGLKVSGEKWNPPRRQGSMRSLFTGPILNGRGGAYKSDNFSGLEQLLQCAAKLVKLCLAFDFDYHRDLSVPESYYTFFTRMADNVYLRQLKHFCLIDFPVTVNALLEFLRKHQNIVSLCMKGLCIPEGERWNPILKYINTNMLDLDALSISCLRQGAHFVELNPDPMIRRDSFRNYNWEQGCYSYTHHCPSGCEKWARAHKYFRHLGRGKSVSSKFVCSRFSISWNWDYPEEVLFEDIAAGFTLGTWYVSFYIVPLIEPLVMISLV